MEAQTKKILKGVGITVGILLIVGIGVMIYIKSTKKGDGDEDENPYTKPRQPNGNTGSTSGSINAVSYTINQIKGMQNWLMIRAINANNQVIIQAIENTGGIDGVIGSGFRKAEAEAIRIGLIRDRAQLFERSK
jgi:hypothetical protein